MDLRPLLTSLHPHQKLLVAFSGGLDSTVLLHQLVTLRGTLAPNLLLRAMHVHHGISRFADEWAIHCQRICQQWQVPLETVRVQLADEGQGLEAQARSARYGALARALQSDEILLTAQHQDDQCETFFLALKRGSGPAGLAAMPAGRPFNNSQLIRPFLAKNRTQLEEWAAIHRLVWIEDESNQDENYDRNFLRGRILPDLQQRWPHFTRAVARSAALCGEQEQLLDELLAEQLASLMTKEGALLIAPLMTMSEIRRAALLRRWLGWQDAKMPTRAGLQQLWDEVAMSREDANPCLQFGRYDLRRYQGALYWVVRATPPAGNSIHWQEPFATLPLPEGLGLLECNANGQRVRAPHSDEPVSVRFKASGILHIVGRDRGRTLKKLWQELHIPPWQRGAIPLLFYGEQLIAAVGIFVTREGQAQEGDESWHLIWKKCDVEKRDWGK